MSYANMNALRNNAIVFCFEERPVCSIYVLQVLGVRCFVSLNSIVA